MGYPKYYVYLTRHTVEQVVAQLNFLGHDFDEVHALHLGDEMVREAEMFKDVKSSRRAFCSRLFKYGVVSLD